MATPKNDDLNPTMRKYLVQIYRLSDMNDSTDYISTSELAETLFVSAPAVNRMVTKLKEAGQIHHEPYRGISLTEKGKRSALIELRRQRIAEVFLVDVMGFEWHEINEEADNMSRTLGDSLTQRMAEMAKFPVRCPHGEPIPNADGTLDELDDVALSEAEQGVELEITRVKTREPDRLQYLAALELKPGRRLELIHAAPFNGPLQLKLDEEYRIIGHNLAELLRVKVVD